MRALVAPVVAACYLFAQSAVLVGGMGCVNPADPVGNGVYYCTMQLSAADRGMNGNLVSLDTFDPLAVEYDPEPFEHQQVELYFEAPGTDTSPACLHLEKIQVDFQNYFNEYESDSIVLRSFEGEDPATQDPLGRTVVVRRESLKYHYDDYGNNGVLEYYAEYGDVFIGIWCVGPQTTEQIAFAVDR